MYILTRDLLFCNSDKYTRFCQWKNLELNIQVCILTKTVHFMFYHNFGKYEPIFHNSFARRCLRLRFYVQY